MQDPPLVLQTAQSLLGSVFANLPSEPFMNVEVALRVFYMLGEVITDKVGRIGGLESVRCTQMYANIGGSLVNCVLTYKTIDSDAMHKLVRM